MSSRTSRQSGTGSWRHCFSTRFREHAAVILEQGITYKHQCVHVTNSFRDACSRTAVHSRNPSMQVNKSIVQMQQAAS